VPLPAYVPTTFMPAAWLSILTIPPPPLPTALKSSARVAAGAIDPNKSKARAS
jgi:hypothetical protein